ncbi:hypothetical protein GXP67_21970 [Rhodocytophaga rosea]|uniref:Uncharacterized protein n=1 Tax=Rhodocytophaga rosea TaxID=2704465 RepID=A0A6C0GNB8_9BACT|nr:hypothetical protein [Rhodocytophaga rosea]QHT69120.1 hypothetical protein GXP67_21970 [Rhodocytophaga rosea]
MKNIKNNPSSNKSGDTFTPVVTSMAILTGIFVAIQAFYFRDSHSLPPLQNSAPKHHIF